MKYKKIFKKMYKILSKAFKKTFKISVNKVLEIKNDKTEANISFLHEKNRYTKQSNCLTLALDLKLILLQS